ncbi:hypothetical protein M758_7G063800 [Ceratodon purpureus]|nr:hypothetical protein M758_7G063800 [Ceratodon purpureus]
MNSEGRPAGAVAGDPVPGVGDGGTGLGIKEPGVVAPSGEAVPVDASGRNGEVKVGRHGRNGSMSGGFLAAPGYSPSFASLGDTSSFESHHGASHSDTFEGFEASKLSDSPEIHETPMVTRPEGLSFTGPGVGGRTPEITEAGTPAPVKPLDGEKQAAGHHTSPIGNLASHHPANVASPSPPTELKPIPGNVDSFTFNRASTTPGTSNEPYVSSKKMPGHELLEKLTTTNKTPTPVTPASSQDVNPIIPPAAEAKSSAPSHTDVAPPVEEIKEAPRESEPVVVKPEPDAAQVVQPKVQAPPLPEEPAVAIPAATDKLDSHTTDSSVAPTVDGSTTEKAVDSSNVATGSEGKIEEVAEKSTGHGIETTDEKEVGEVKPPETAAFQNVEAEKVVPASFSTETPKPGTTGKLTTISTKKWHNPTDADLKTMVVIPEYLSRDMENAVKSTGEAIPEGRPAGQEIVAPTCPILVFINSKSGGRLGPELMKHFEELISSYQVYDLAKHSPSAVLQYGLGCLDKMAKSGDECARKTLEKLRILVAGGDGTVGWVLSSVGALRELPEPISIPPVGVIPLGTGNDLSRSFGWGGEFASTSKSTLKRVLVKALGSNASPLDTWTAVVMPAKSVAADNIEFPHAMHPQHHVPLPSAVAGENHAKDERDPAFEGLFFNYFSVGMDAQVAYGFHHLRDAKPWLARGRTANQMIYSSFGCTQGWFCTACSVAPRARGVSNILKLLVKKRGSKDWEDIHLPSNIRAVVICNLKSYAGGRNPWGKPSSGRREKEGFEEQRCDDGVLEVMGLKDGWHSAFVLLEVSTAVRLCQAEAIKLELNGKARTKAYLQMDGEPWMQPMGTPEDATPTVVMIEKLPHPSLLLKR